MENHTIDIGETIAKTIQLLGTSVALLVVGGWAWQLAEGNVVGFGLLMLLATLFIAPVIAWGLPPVAMLLGLLAQGAAALIRRRRSRA